MLRKQPTIDKKRSEESKNSALKQILDNAVVAEGVRTSSSWPGWSGRTSACCRTSSWRTCGEWRENLAVELLERLLHEEIRSRSRTNVVQEKKFSDRLIEALRKYHNRVIESAQVIEEMIAMAKDLQAAKRHEELGLNPAR